MLRSVPSPTATSRDLRLLAGAVFLSAAGDLLALIALALHVHALTGSGLAVSALFAATLVAAVAAALAFSGDLAAILALPALLASANAFGHTAEFTLIAAVAGARRVTEATGIVEAARSAGLAAGPLLG